ncbi:MULTISPECIES: hypothetical protein [Micrococcaceae]|uniref:hypothetical protein n=1 Tax=Micrococcaceae TaxID=1268 RepID=UPI0006F3E70C|nr:hypothetical protein [Arthrobacter sp. Soil761]KRE77161.1 hypothetical protein ASG79_17390 [Arthrobacter sp. Soil761]
MEDTRNHRHASNQFVGSAVVAGAVYGSRTTLLKLQTFAGEFIEYIVGDIPDPVGAAEFSSNNLSPIAVQIQHGGKRCSVIALTPEGPRRSIATLGTALALHRSGAHTVVDGGLKSGVPCSIHKTAKSIHKTANERPSLC